MKNFYKNACDKNQDYQTRLRKEKLRICRKNPKPYKEIKNTRK